MFVDRADELQRQSRAIRPRRSGADSPTTTVSDAQERLRAQALNSTAVCSSTHASRLAAGSTFQVKPERRLVIQRVVAAVVAGQRQAQNRAMSSAA
jgi:hypothetical protein